jgi:hypothetical protein
MYYSFEKSYKSGKRQASKKRITHNPRLLLPVIKKAAKKVIGWFYLFAIEFSGMEKQHADALFQTKNPND